MVIVDKTSLKPGKIICIGRNYVKHIEELHNDFPKEMVLFQKSASSISEQLLHPMKSCRFEAEICFIIKDKKIFAFGGGLDLTLDEEQNYLKSKGLPWERAKSFKNSAVFTDFISLDYKGDLFLKLYKNDILQQYADEALMIYPVKEILEQCENVFGLEDNDIIMTGTPEGVSHFLPNDKFTIKLYHKEKLLVQKSWITHTV